MRSLLILLGLLIPSKLLLADQLRDPTTPLGGVSQVQENALHLQAILLRNGQRKVIINGELLVAGQSISGYTIERVNEQSVQLRSSDGPLVLQLRQKVIKK